MLTPMADKILTLLKERNDKAGFQAINKNMFPGESLESFFGSLTELKNSGLVSFYKEYTYKPYSGFGDMTPKQYNTMDILLKLNVPADN
jgi:hypothetical protein